MTAKVTLPQLGESVVEGTIGGWRVKIGDFVKQEDALVDILSDKTSFVVNAPAAGKVVAIHANIDDVIAVGGLLAEIEVGAIADATAPSAAPAKEAPAASPGVRKMAREHDVDLGAMKGSGDGGRITRDDVKAAAAPAAPVAAAPVAAAAKAPTTTPSAPSAPAKSAFVVPPYVASPGDEIVPFSRRRRIIADHMVYSKHVAPEVVTLAECDLQATHLLREKYKKQYEAEGHALTFLAFVAAATARALREFPELNARVLDDAYVKLRNVNLGVAVDTPEGLVVPAIKNADELTVRGIARAIGDLAKRARVGGLRPDELRASTFSISNPGRQGNLVGGAIISQPNVGILRLGTIKKRPVVLEVGGDDVIAIHPVMHMALTYDHRIVDGVHANGFLFRITEILEKGDFEL